MPFDASDWNVIWSGDDTEVFWEYADLSGWAHFFTNHELRTLEGGALHWHNGQVLTGPAAPLDHFAVDSSATTVFIGYNPDTNTYLDARVKAIGADPPAYSPDP
ncbi:hypothetical protein KFU94_08845 [Chloroflexi bacterium TSY]|nr:hypothetical protein [Chloroflexi bacterium TSY]